MSIWPVPAALLCAGLEASINKALSLNIDSSADLQTLEGKRLAIHLTELSTPIVLVVAQAKIIVSNDSHAADCQINTSFSTLYELKQQASLTALIREGQLDLLGDIKVAQNFAKFAESLTIDWQTELASYIGDVATHKLTQFGRTLFTKAQFFTEQVSADSSEWLLHEQKLAVTQPELTQFSEQVNNTAQQLAQLQQRINQLIPQLITHNQNQAEQG